MDSQPVSDNCIDIVDNGWRAEQLPDEDIQVPLDKLPDPENNEDGTSFSLNQDDKWLDLDLAGMTRHSEDQLNNSNL